MSLDLYLYGPEEEHQCECPHCFNEHTAKRRETLYDTNITHNLGGMANEAGFYNALWRPEEIGITKAAQIIPCLEVGIRRLEENPDYYRQFSAKNGWGTYDQFLPWLRELLEACRSYPEATVEASR